MKHAILRLCRELSWVAPERASRLAARVATACVAVSSVEEVAADLTDRAWECVYQVHEALTAHRGEN